MFENLISVFWKFFAKNHTGKSLRSTLKKVGLAFADGGMMIRIQNQASLASKL